MKITVNKFVHIDANSTAGKPKFDFFDCDMSDYGEVPIGQQDITIEIPDDFNPVPLQINALKEAQAKVRAEAESKIVALDEKIQKLLAIEAPVSPCV